MDFKKMTKKELLEYGKDNGIVGITNKLGKDKLCEIILEELKRIEIKNDLLDQLERNGVYGQHYTDLVEDYMRMWEVKNELYRDIKNKGVNIKYQNSETQWGYKKNDSVGELTRTNNQMLKLLDSLGLKASKFENELIEEEDDEM